MKINYSKKEIEKELFNAVWQWVLDHSDLDASGQLFLKAHIKNKQGFARSIEFRMNGAYRSFIKDGLIIERQKEHIENVKIGRALKKVEEENRKILNNRKWWQKLLNKII